MRATNATPWDGKTGYWWQDTTGINQAVVPQTNIAVYDAVRAIPNLA